MMTLSKSDRERRAGILIRRYRDAVPRVKGGVPYLLLRPEVVEAWGWILLRASLDIGTESEVPEETRIADELNETDSIVALITRDGARVAFPEAYNAADFRPVPTVEFWKSHVTGEPLPNPFADEDSESVTQQMWIERNLGKDFANELRIAARGGRTYQEEFERRQTIALADAAKNLPADFFNPYFEAFEPGDKSPASIAWQQRRADEIHRLENENPPLATWLKKIARKHFVNPFEAGDAWNLTRQMTIERADGLFAAHLRRTGSFKALQLQDEFELAQRAAAEAKAAAEEARIAFDSRQRRARFGSHHTP